MWELEHSREKCKPEGGYLRHAIYTSSLSLFSKFFGLRRCILNGLKDLVVKCNKKLPRDFQDDAKGGQQLEENKNGTCMPKPKVFVVEQKMVAQNVIKNLYSDQFSM